MHLLFPQYILHILFFSSYLDFITSRICVEIVKILMCTFFSVSLFHFMLPNDTKEVTNVFINKISMKLRQHTPVLIQCFLSVVCQPCSVACGTFIKQAIMKLYILFLNAQEVAGMLCHHTNLSQHLK